MIKAPTFESAKSRRVLVALIVAVILAVSSYYGLKPDPELVEDVVEVAVDETLAPEAEETLAPEAEAKEEPEPATP